MRVGTLRECAAPKERCPPGTHVIDAFPQRNSGGLTKDGLRAEYAVLGVMACIDLVINNLQVDEEGVRGVFSIVKFAMVSSSRGVLPLRGISDRVANLDAGRVSVCHTLCADDLL
jgi:hypothetical protein